MERDPRAYLWDVQQRVGWAKRSVPTGGGAVGTLRFAHPTSTEGVSDP